MAVSDEGRISSVDVAVGQRLRILRQARSWSQSQLGSWIGVSGQQIQKYEVGQSRIAAGRILELALALDVPVSAMFESIKHVGPEQAQSAEPTDTRGQIVAHRFDRLPENQKRVVLSLIESLAQGSGKVNGSPSGT